MDKRTVNTKIQKMIEEMCPDGVEYKKLGDIGKFFGGLTGKNKYDFDKGNALYATYKNVYANPALDIGLAETVSISPGEKQNALAYGDIIFTGSSETPNECGLSSVVTEQPEDSIYLNSFCFFLRPNDSDILLPDFAKHLFRSSAIRRQIVRTANGVTRFNVSKEKMKNVLIPVPPLAVQREVVRVLDTMTELTAELTAKLTAELTARTKQYAYYMDELLRLENVEGVEHKRVGDIFKRLRGTPITACKMKEIAREDGDIRIFAGGKTVIDACESDIPKANITRVPAVLVQSRGIVDFVYYDKPFTFKNEMWAYTADNAITVKYLYYCLKNNLERFRDEASKMGSMPQISIRITEDFVIPVPPLSVQQEIVTKLDAFSSYCTDLTTGLPAEIAAREKQYAYYRDTILQFDGK